MSDTQSRNRHSPNESRPADRGERKRAWRDEGDKEGGRSGGRDDRGSKQMKQGALGMKVLVPNSLVGAIIGKGGEEMKKLKEESSCFIRLSQNDKYFPNTNERPCYIEGMPEDIVKAVQAIQEKLMNDNPRRGPSIEDSRKKQCRIIVGSNAAGKCIGKGGENVKRLNSEHSVWVKVMGRDDSIPGLEERTVTINGELENAIKAVQDILEMSAALTNGGTDKNLDYDQYNSSGGGAGGGAQGGSNFSQGYNQGGEGYNNQGGNFGNQQQGYNNQPGSGNMVRSGSMGAAPNMGRSGSSGPPSNMGGGYNNMGGGPAPPAANNMGGGPNLAVAPANMGGGNFNNQTPPVQQYNNTSQQPSQFGQPGQFQGGIQQYSGQTNSNIPIQQYPGGNTGQGTSGYGANPSGGYNQQPAGGYNQAGQGYNQQPTGAYNQPSTGGGYNQQAVAPVANATAGAGGFNQSQGFNNQGSQGYQAPPVGNQGAGFQGGNQQAGFQGGNQGGNFQAGRGGYQGARGGNQATGGRGNFRGGNNGRGGSGRGGSGRGGRGN